MLLGMTITFPTVGGCPLGGQSFPLLFTQKSVPYSVSDIKASIAIELTNSFCVHQRMCDLVSLVAWSSQ